jgi:hypothetical protein
MTEQGELEKIKHLEFVSRNKLQNDKRQITTSMSYRHDISHNLDGPKKFSKGLCESQKVFLDEYSEQTLSNEKIMAAKNFPRDTNTANLASGNTGVAIATCMGSPRNQFWCPPNLTEKNFFAVNYFLQGQHKHNKKQIKPNKYLTLSNVEVSVDKNITSPLTGVPTKDHQQNISSLEVETQALLQGQEVNIDFLVNLRREVPNSFTEAPSGRQDAILLTRWLDKCVPYIKELEKTAGVSKVSELLREIHSIAFKEILREVGLQCQERGALLSKIWDFFEKARREEERELFARIQALQ